MRRRVASICTDVGGSNFRRNIGMNLPDYTVSNPWPSYIHDQREYLKIPFDCRISSKSAAMYVPWHFNNTHVLLPREASQLDFSPHMSTILVTNAEKYQISHIKKHHDCRHRSFLHVYNLSFEANSLSR
jgi:hypothetical protein